VFADERHDEPGQIGDRPRLGIPGFWGRDGDTAGQDVGKRGHAKLEQGVVVGKEIADGFGVDAAGRRQPQATAA